jgi:hypothetical protein
VKDGKLPLGAIEKGKGEERITYPQNCQLYAVEAITKISIFTLWRK